MSVFSSLSLWSSIKLFSSPYISSAERKFASVPYVAAYNDNEQNNGGKSNHSISKVVNLKIPQKLKTRKKSSSFVTFKDSKVQKKEKTTINKLLKGNSTIPSGKHFKSTEELKEFEKTISQEETDSSKIIDLVEARKEFENYFRDWDPDLEPYFSKLYDIEYEETEMGNKDGKNPNWVPSVKPWTLEELGKINDLYNTMEEKIKKIELKKDNNRHKKKHTLLKTEEDFKGPSCYRLSQGDPQLSLRLQPSSSSLLDEWDDIFFDCDFATSDSDSDAQTYAFDSAKIKLSKRMAQLSEEDYYKTKLAQLYLIANGS